MTNNIPLLPQDVAGEEGNALVVAINDRLRRISTSMNSMAGAQGAQGPPGMTSGSIAAPGSDTQVIFNKKGKFAAESRLVWDYNDGDLIVTGPANTGVIAPLFNSTATGGDNAITQKDLTFHITGAGDAFFQTATATTTFNSLADQAQNPATTAAFQTSEGDFQVFGDGSVFGQNATMTTVFNSRADLATDPATTAAFQTSEGDFQVFGDGSVHGQNASMTTVFNSLSDQAADPATTAAFQTSQGDFQVFGDGSIRGQNATVTTVFNSLADMATDPATTAAFQTSLGDFQVFGDGSIHGQSASVTTVFNSLADQATDPSTTAAFQTSKGDFIVYGNGNVQGQQLRLTYPLDTQICFMQGTLVSGDPNFTYTPTGPNAGLAAVTFNSLADKAADPATTAAFQTSGGDFVVYGDGSIHGQNISVTGAFNSLADQSADPATTAAFQTSLGDFQVFGDGSIHGQSLWLTVPTDTQVLFMKGKEVWGDPSLVYIESGPNAGLAAPTLNSTADTAADPATTAAFQTSKGDFQVFGDGSIHGQSASVTSTFNSLADQSTSPATTAAFQTSLGDFQVFGDGTVHGQSVTATSTFNSLADQAANPATTAAFQTSKGDFIVYGNGNFQGQSLSLTDPLAPQYGGTGISTIGATGQVLMGGSPYSWGFISAGNIAAPGNPGDVIINQNGAFGANDNFTTDGNGGVAVRGSDSGYVCCDRGDINQQWLMYASGGAPAGSSPQVPGLWRLYTNLVSQDVMWVKSSGDMWVETSVTTGLFNSDAASGQIAFQTDTGTFQVGANGDVGGQWATFSSVAVQYYGGVERYGCLFKTLFDNYTAYNRWYVAESGDAEISPPAAGNAQGSNLIIGRFDDVGNFIDHPPVINRATGLVSINNLAVGVFTAPAPGAPTQVIWVDGNGHFASDANFVYQGQGYVAVTGGNCGYGFADKSNNPNVVAWELYSWSNQAALYCFSSGSDEFVLDANGNLRLGILTTVNGIGGSATGSVYAQSYNSSASDTGANVNAFETRNGNFYVRGDGALFCQFADTLQLCIDGNVPSNRIIFFRSIVANNPEVIYNRWAIYCDAGAEDSPPASGNAAGSDFRIDRYDDVGGSFPNGNTALYISRATGMVLAPYGFVAPGTPNDVLFNNDGKIDGTGYFTHDGNGGVSISGQPNNNACGYYFTDRLAPATGPGYAGWVLYAADGICQIWNNVTGNVLQLLTSGELDIPFVGVASPLFNSTADKAGGGNAFQLSEGAFHIDYVGNVYGQWVTCHGVGIIGVPSADRSVYWSTIVNPGQSNEQTLARWALAIDGPENGGNSGSDFYINRYDDSGNNLPYVLSISRATGIVYIPNLSANLVAPGSQGQVIYNNNNLLAADSGMVYYGAGSLQVSGSSAAFVVYDRVSGDGTSWTMYSSYDVYRIYCNGDLLQLTTTGTLTVLGSASAVVATEFNSQATNSQSADAFFSGQGTFNIYGNGNARFAAGVYANLNDGYSQFRAVSPAVETDCSFLIRNDGVTTYFLLTTAGQDPYGNFNSLRPFYIDNASGNVYIPSLQAPGVSQEVIFNWQGEFYANGNLNFDGGGSLSVSGAGAALWLGDRNNFSQGVQWAFYSAGDILRILYDNGSAGTDVIQIDASGQINVLNAAVVATQFNAQAPNNWTDAVFAGSGTFNIYGNGNARFAAGVYADLNDNYAQFRATDGASPAFMIRNDGANAYFLWTNPGQTAADSIVLGIWNDLRPIIINNTTGNVTIGSGAPYQSSLTVTGNLTVDGSISGSLAAPGVNGSLIFNSSNVFTGNGDLTYNSTTRVLTIANGGAGSGFQSSGSFSSAATGGNPAFETNNNNILIYGNGQINCTSLFIGANQAVNGSVTFVGIGGVSCNAGIQGTSFSIANVGVVINSNGQFVSAGGINCNAGIGATGFNPTVGGVGYNGVTGSFTTSDGHQLQVHGGIVTYIV